jgi:hypothetical protein
VPDGFRAKADQSGSDGSFDEAVILLDNAVEVYDLPQFDCLGKCSENFEVYNVAPDREHSAVRER